MALTGKCACGAIRYECTTEPLVMANCHCRDCQRASGTGFSSAIAVLRDSVTVHGTPKWHDVQADSGHTARRAFCPECGTPLFACNTASPAILAIKPGSLDDPSIFRPVVDIWTSSAQAWTPMDPATVKVEKNPPGG